MNRRGNQYDEQEDGQMDLYIYSWIDSIWTETVTRVHEDEPDPVAMQTTRRSSIYNRIGNLVEQRTELMTSAGVWEQIDGAAYEYSVNGKETKRTTFNGLITTSEWAGTCCGKSSETAPDGTRTTFTYDDSGRLIVRTVLDPNPIETHIGYDALGRQTVTWATNRVAHLGTTPLRTAYDALGRVVSQTDNLGNTTTYSYSANERTRTVTQPTGATQTTLTDESGRILSVSGTAVAPRTYTYGVNAVGSQWTKGYNGSNATALAWTKTTEDLLGRTIREERPGYGGTTLVTEYAYDADSRLVAVTEASQPVLTYAYNHFGQRVATTQTVGNEWRKTDQDTEYVRIGGELWQVAASTQSCSDSSIAPLAFASRRQLTGLTSVNPTRMENIDARGNVVESWAEFDPDTKIQSTLRRTPYATNIAISCTRFGRNIESVSLSGVTNTPGYDGLGRVVSAMDGRGNTTVFLYNFRGQRVCAVDAATNATWYAFDNFGRLAALTNALGEATVYEYNLQGRKTYEGGGTYPVRFAYDDEGRMAGMTTYRDESELGDTTVWTYDPATGVLLCKTYADGKGPSYTYSPDGKLATRTWARGVTTTYAYDGWGNLTNTVHSDGTPSVSMAYDVLGRQNSSVDAAGVTTFAYDSFSSLTNETVAGQYAKTLDRHVDGYGRNVGYSLDSLRKQTLAYDPATGRIVGMGGFAWQYLLGTDLKQSLSYPNGAVAEWVYEPQRDLLTLVSNDVFSAYAYENDPAGRRTTKNTEHYGYNTRGELIAATNTAPVAHYAYSFDDIGNRIVAHELGTNFAYTANALNQYTNIIAEAVFIPEFDDDGNQTLVKTSTGIWYVSYNAENRPVMWSNETAIVTMDFDRKGRRVWYKSVSNGQTNAFSKFVYDGYLCVQQLDGLTGSVEQEFVWDPTETIATRPLKWTLPATGRTFHYFHDGNKNVSDVIDASDSSLAAHYEYAPFGAVTVATGPLAAVSPFRFSSEYHDDAIGCVYYNYRHYNPLDGRWMSKDPMGEEGSLNLSLFCNNSCWMYIDSLGNAPMLYVNNGDSFDFVTWYWIGRGRGINLSSWTHIEAFKERLRGSVGQMKSQVQMKMPPIDCQNSPFVPVTYSGKIQGDFVISNPASAWFDPIFDVHQVMNQGGMHMSYNCSGLAMCQCVPATGEWESVGGKVSCKLQIEIFDSFNNPLDRNVMDGGTGYRRDEVLYKKCRKTCQEMFPILSSTRHDCYKHCETLYPRSEEFLAKPYDIYATWEDSLEFSF